ncbi:cAMP-responsive element modulator-like isoform X1 [Synchiropus splendidus]|uniref:cAMP-responsive element modulator-like isoform X1 n=1 Tax=Synchiropus splendidus TaxID=270530 RepID=UPI00237D7D09|nr:cAMP-responsive element modulator-like isoform X1 [Synchiropus splendidus]
MIILHWEHCNSTYTGCGAFNIPDNEVDFDCVASLPLGGDRPQFNAQLCVTFIPPLDYGTWQFLCVGVSTLNADSSLEMPFLTCDFSEMLQHFDDYCSQHTLTDPAQYTSEDQGKLQFSQETAFVMAGPLMQNPHNSEMLQSFPDLSAMIGGQPLNAVPPFNDHWQGVTHLPYSCPHTEPADPFQVLCGSSEILQSTTHVQLPPTRSVVHSPPNRNLMLDVQHTPAVVLRDVQMNSTGLLELLKKDHSQSTTEQQSTQKQLHRLARNREAARQARRRKNNYIRALQERERELQRLNQSLLEEIQAVKKKITQDS